MTKKFEKQIINKQIIYIKQTKIYKYEKKIYKKKSCTHSRDYTSFTSNTKMFISSVNLSKIKCS